MNPAPLAFMIEHYPRTTIATFAAVGVVFGGLLWFSPPNIVLPPPPFEAGDVVHHRLDGSKAIVDYCRPRGEWCRVVVPDDVFFWDYFVIEEYEGEKP